MNEENYDELSQAEGYYRYMNEDDGFDPQYNGENDMEAHSESVTGRQVSCIFDKEIDKKNEPLLNTNKQVSRVSDEEDRWAIDSRATTHCTEDQELFESLNSLYKGSLGTASTSHQIEGIGMARVLLAKGVGYTRLGGVKYVPGMRGNLLSTTVLAVNGIYSELGPRGYCFYKKVGSKRELVAKGVMDDLTCYLDWVSKPNTLLTNPRTTGWLVLKQMEQASRTFLDTNPSQN